MANLAYINIIQNAPTPLIIIFGIAHAAMAWVIYVYAKNLFREIVRRMAGKEVKSRYLIEKSKISSSSQSLEYRMNVIFGIIYDKLSTDRDVIIQEAEKIAWSSYTMHIARATIFFGCWGIIAGIRYFYANPPYCEPVSQNLINSLHNFSGLC